MSEQEQNETVTTEEVTPSVEQEENHEATSETEASTPETKEEAAEEKQEEGEKPLEELPLPGDEDTESKKTLPKWVEKKLSRKDRELEVKAQEAAMYRTQLEQIQQAIPAAASTIADPTLPRREAFANEAEFVAAVFDHKQAQSEKKAAQQRQQHALVQAETSFRERLKSAMDDGSEKYEDFEDKIKPLFSQEFPANRAMAEAIVDSEHKHDIFYFLGQHPEEAKKIAMLNPVQAVKKIAEIEARFNARKSQTTSKAPAPIGGVKTNQVKGKLVNNLTDLAKLAETGSQQDFEAAVRRMNEQASVW
jgi:hypothetical protein